MRHPLIVLATLVLVSCTIPSGGRPTEEEMSYSKPLDVPGREVVWIWVTQELSNAGYRLDTLHSSAAAGEFETQWDTMPSPQRYNGIRRKVVGSLLESVEEPGKYVVMLGVWQQRNKDIENPLEMTTADWEDQEPDVGAADVLIYRIESRLEQ